MRVAIDGAGRIVVPKVFRDRLGIVGRSQIELEESGGEIVIRPVPGEVALVEHDGHLVAQRGAEAPALDWEVVRELVEGQRR